MGRGEDPAVADEAAAAEDEGCAATDEPRLPGPLPRPHHRPAHYLGPRRPALPPPAQAACNTQFHTAGARGGHAGTRVRV